MPIYRVAVKTTALTVKTPAVVADTPAKAIIKALQIVKGATEARVLNELTTVTEDWGYDYYE